MAQLADTVVRRFSTQPPAWRTHAAAVSSAGCRQSIGDYLEACGLPGISAAFDQTMLVLTGDVDSHFERILAEDYVKRFAGIRVLNNRINVRVPAALSKSIAERIRELALLFVPSAIRRILFNVPMR